MFLVSLPTNPIEALLRQLSQIACSISSGHSCPVIL